MGGRRGFAASATDGDGSFISSTFLDLVCNGSSNFGPGLAKKIYLTNNYLMSQNIINITQNIGNEGESILISI